jgi:hypothetical protein
MNFYVDVEEKINLNPEDNYHRQFHYPKHRAVSLKWFHGKLF